MVAMATRDAASIRVDGTAAQLIGAWDIASSNSTRRGNRTAANGKLPSQCS
jgi:hypothetical protein